MADLHETTTRQRAMLAAAAHALDGVLNSERFTHAAVGEERLIRCEARRDVTFIELSDGSGAVLRIEIFRK